MYNVNLHFKKNLVYVCRHLNNYQNSDRNPSAMID